MREEFGSLRRWERGSRRRWGFNEETEDSMRSGFPRSWRVPWRLGVFVRRCGVREKIGVL